jgi:hypothetical protein
VRWSPSQARPPRGEFGAVGGAEFGTGAVGMVFDGAHRDDQAWAISRLDSPLAARVTTAAQE